MAEGGPPSVFVVDSYTTRPAVPPRLSPGRRTQRGGVAQTLLFLLVSVALCGMAIEACFIYRLYQPKPADPGSSSKITGDVPPPTERPRLEVLPSKPVAHLTDGQDVHHENRIMAWSTVADPLLYEMDYKNGSLVIQKEGYYYVYSKVSFSDTKVFHHSVEWKTKRYQGTSITLLMSRKVLGSNKNHKLRSDSFQGGVFRFFKDDAIFVKVSDTSKVSRHGPSENTFGAYMI